jgi:hypothetical protein
MGTGLGSGTIKELEGERDKAVAVPPAPLRIDTPVSIGEASAEAEIDPAREENPPPRADK